MAVARCTTSSLAPISSGNEESSGRQLLDGPQNDAIVISADR